MATSKNRQQNNEDLFAGIDELLGAAKGLVEGSKALDNAIKDGRALLKNAESVLSKAVSDTEKTLTFSTMSLQQSFKYSTWGKNTAQERRIKNDLDFQRSKIELNETIKKMQEAAKNMEEAAGGQEEAAKNAEYGALQIRLNEAITQQKRLENINFDKAMRNKVINSTAQYAIKAIGNAASTIIDIIGDLARTGFNNVYQALETNYNSITSKNSIGSLDYHKLVDSMQKFIDKNDLSSIISVADLTPRLKQITESGYIGKNGAKIAEFSVLAELNNFSADLSDPAFLKSIKNMEAKGRNVDKYLETIVASTDGIIETLDDASGFANGQLNTLMTSISDLGQVVNLTDRAIQENYKSYASLQGILGSTNFDPTKIFNTIQEAATTGLYGMRSNFVTALGFEGQTGEEIKSEIAKNGTEKYTLNAMKFLYENLNGKTPEFQAAFLEQSGSPFTVEDVQSVFNKYNSYDKFERAYEKAQSGANKGIKDIYNELHNYVTDREKTENKYENALTDSAQLGQKSYEVYLLMNQALNAISGHTAVIAANAAWNFGNDIAGMFKKGTMNNGGSGTGFFKSFANSFKSGKATQSAQQAIPGYENAVGNAGKTAVSAGGKGTGFLSKAGNLAGKAAPYAAIAAGGIMAIADGIQAGKESGSVGWGVLGGITGVSHKSDADKIAEARENGGKLSLDWGSAFSNAGKGALIGGGAGLFASPIGGAIGAAAGGISGFVSNLIHQAKEMEKVNAYMKTSLSKISENAKKAADSTSEALRIHNEYLSVEDQIADLEVEKNNASEEESKLIQRNIDLLEKQNDARLKEIADKLDVGSAKSAGNAAVKAVKLEKLFTKLEAAEKKYQDGDKDAFKDITRDDLQRAVDTGLLTESALTAWDKAMEGDDQLSKDAAKRGLGLLVNGQGIDGSFYTGMKGSDYTAFSGGTKTKSYKDAQEGAEAALEDASKANNDAYKLLSDYTDKATNTDIQQAIRMLFETNKEIQATLYGEEFGKGTESFKELYGDTPEEFFERFGFSKDRYEKYKKWLEAGNSQINPDSDSEQLVKGYFSTGLDEVPYDNYLAMLHKGEQVRTAADVTAERTAQKTQAQINTMLTALNNGASGSQADTIIALLQTICGLLAQRNSTNFFDTVTSNNNKLPSNAHA